MTAPLLAAVEAALRAVPPKDAVNGWITKEVDYLALARVVVGWIGPANDALEHHSREDECLTCRGAIAALPGQPGEEERK